MPLYHNGVIYKLKHNLDYDDINIYIGSTTNFKNRKNNHKTVCNNVNNKKYNMPVYQYIRDNGGWDQFIMIPIEPYSCYSKKELEIRERYHIDLLRPTLNKAIPTRSVKEWLEANKEHRKEIMKEWREANKEKIKEYYENNKEVILEKTKEYSKANKEKIKEQKKQYRENNKEKLKEYYENNKEKIKEKARETRKQKVICDHCGCEIRKDCLLRHQRTKKCIDFVKKG